MPVRVIVGVHQQLPQQLHSFAEIPPAKRTISARVIVAVRYLEIK